MADTDTPQPQDSPTPPLGIPALDEPATPERCLEDYREAANRRSGNGGW